MSSTVKATLEAYERWARVYPPVAHNPLMRGEQAAMLELLPAVAGSRVLDLACGSGRYSRLLLEANAGQVVALDFCIPMLQQVASASRVCGSMMQLPFQANSFDCVISGLALGHATDIYPWMCEIARVLRPGGCLLYSDFHPQAARAGMTRSFKDDADETWTVPHRAYDLECQQQAVAAAGLTIQALSQIRVGVELTEAFAGSDSIYRDWHGLPLVLVVQARK
jgi:ubiquinone/menaquinone biosynthesis C-methylase UbiE